MFRPPLSWDGRALDFAYVMNRDDLEKIDAAIRRLQDPMIRDRELQTRIRRRSKPPYTPDCPSPVTPNVIKIKEELSWRLSEQQACSFVRQQFEDQKTDLYRLDFVDPNEAQTMVENIWKEQGIWDDENYTPGFIPIAIHWQHEDIEDKNSDAAPPQVPAMPLTLASTKFSANDSRTNASRPYQQFMFQMNREYKRLQALAEATSDPALVQSGGKYCPHSMGTKAYENVKEIWKARKIWYRKWTVFPGYQWMHEIPLDKLIAEELRDAVLAAATAWAAPRRTEPWDGFAVNLEDVFDAPLQDRHSPAQVDVDLTSPWPIYEEIHKPCVFSPCLPPKNRGEVTDSLSMTPKFTLESLTANMGKSSAPTRRRSPRLRKQVHNETTSSGECTPHQVPVAKRPRRATTTKPTAGVKKTRAKTTTKPATRKRRAQK